MTIVYSTYTIGPSTSGGTDNTAAATRRAKFMISRFYLIDSKGDVFCYWPIQEYMVTGILHPYSLYTARAYHINELMVLRL